MRTSCTRWDVVMIVLCAILVVATGGAVSRLGSEEAFRASCAKNLARLGKTMEVYSRDYEDEYPRAGGWTNEWVPTIPNWAAANRLKAFGIERVIRTVPHGKTTSTSSLYLLVKYAEAYTPEFVCPSEPATREFRLRDAPEELPRGFELIDAWDFGGRYDDCNNPSRHCSYAYQMSFDKPALTMAHPAGMAVAADRNPWMDPNRVKDATLGWARFAEASGDADANRLRLGNSDAHRREGQNVLFVDGHVTFQTRPTCGVKGDNIYTLAARPSEPAESKEVVPPVYGSLRPTSRTDSVLVQELPFTLAEPAAAGSPKK
jgi:prepilin-type processing-associated H-X9-DG protein